MTPGGVSDFEPSWSSAELLATSATAVAGTRSWSGTVGLALAIGPSCTVIVRGAAGPSAPSGSMAMTRVRVARTAAAIAASSRVSVTFMWASLAGWVHAPRRGPVPCYLAVVARMSCGQSRVPSDFAMPTIPDSSWIERAMVRP